MNFISSCKPPENRDEPAWWYLFHENAMLVHVGAEFTCVPRITNPESIHVHAARRQYLGTLNGVHCHAADIDGPLVNVPEGMSCIPLRDLFDALPPDIFRVALCASGVMYWDRTHQFCGQCGHPTRLSGNERAKICTACGFKSYPRISPAIIVAVIRDGKILLGHSKRFPRAFYSVLAGFVEPGETFEECVAREVKEEAGIDVRNPRYLASQPWPFPDSLMVGFTAEYAGGEIKVDGEEVSDAGWFSPDNLPEIPGKISIARLLIDWFVEQYR